MVQRIALILCLAVAQASAAIFPDVETLLKEMNRAYATVKDYRTMVRVIIYRDDGSFETKKFSYAFKKPGLIRLDLESPHRGMIVVYPDEKGRAVVQPPGLARSFKLHLATDSFFLNDLSGQRIDETDMGLLIRNISLSLGAQRRGPLEMEEENGRLRIRVLAADHFRKGVITQYTFMIDRKTWFPVEVGEATQDGRPARTIIFTNFTVNTGVSDNFFRLDNQTEGENERIDGK